ncbi:M15 family metallopeptidase [Ligaoa zhengdingensis]|uniref:M15 family metallopeptidase n=1 Tax=Ligaoa zhengdingensis TaxID=2763658 RepID=UPI0031BB2625
MSNESRRGYNPREINGRARAGRPSSPPPHRRRRRRSNPWPAILLAALLVGAVAVGVVACSRQADPGSTSSESPSSSSELSGAAIPSSSSAADDPSSPSEPESTSSDSESASASSESSSSASEPEDLPASATTDGDWRLVLVNPTHKLNGDYDVELAPVNANYQLDARIVEDMQAMIAAAKEAGYSLQICSAYRSTDRSRVLYNNKVNQYKAAGYSDEDAAVEAAKWVAPPGTSEHNTGLAADIVSADYFTKYADLEHDFETFDEFKWLYANCADYGFILRYPKDKQEITGITYEPWHYRYVGREHAKKIMEQKICLEEYLGELD